jgi:hypothetical protein
LKIGPCSALIYIGDHQTVTKPDELNGIIEKFKENKNAIYVNEKIIILIIIVFYIPFQVDCRMEVDEIYEDLKTEILKHI